MNPLEFSIGEHIIIYRLDWLGIETVLLDGNKISKKLSLGKRVHTFKLLVDGTMQTFHLESKQSFNSGFVRVQLFQNRELIDTDFVSFFGGTTSTDVSSNKNDHSMLSIGMMFIVLTLCFDWSRVFLLIGLIYLFCAVSDSSSKATSKNNNTIEPKN